LTHSFVFIRCIAFDVINTDEFRVLTTKRETIPAQRIENGNEVEARRRKWSYFSGGFQRLIYTLLTTRSSWGIRSILR